MKLVYPQIPEVNIETVTESGHIEEIFNMLCSGISPVRVADLIFQRHHVAVPPADIAAFAEAIDQDYFVPYSKIAERLNRVDAQVDAITEYARMLLLQRDRVDAAVLAEEVAQGDSEASRQVNKEMRTYLMMLEKYIRLRQELGELPKEPMKIQSINIEEGSGGKSLKDILEGDDEAE